MAQQTINVGTAPNDGTGTPLRTAFQYTNSNFSELYTAVGPSGNNIVVPGSATITGDLTVKTNVLKVDTTNNRVGIGTASPAYPLQVAGRISYSSGIGEGADLTVSSSGVSLQFGLGSSWTQQLWYLSGAEAMRLNSTGLGVGVSPAYKIHANAECLFNGVLIGTNGDSINGTTGLLVLRTSGSERLRIDSSGNLGIGVTPSAWSAAFKGIDISTGGAIAGSSDSVRLFANSAYNTAGNNVYKNTAAAARFDVQGNVYTWNQAPSGTAGTAITFTPAMTLDGSGNLLVGKSSASATTIGFEGRANGTVNSTLASSVDANATYAAYSTGAAAYRFYVGMGGTVYATNTTISAISDARLKENVQDIDVGLGAILALKPRKFDWKAGKGKDIKGDRGFIAQEFEQVFPNLIDEWKDPAPEGEAPYKSVRQDLIPVLVKAIQELTARVQTLETR